jgi:hypothetical protein
MGWPMEEDRERSPRMARKGATPVPVATRLGLDSWVLANVEFQMDTASVVESILKSSCDTLIRRVATAEAAARVFRSVYCGTVAPK